MEIVSNITTLISNDVTFAGCLLLFGAVTHGTNRKDQNGARAMVGGVMIYSGMPTV
jgi:hypothetical protein